MFSANISINPKSPRNIPFDPHHSFPLSVIPTGWVRLGSFSRNCTIQYANCGWYTLSVLALCNGNKTLIRNTLCSSFNGNAKPLMMLKERMIENHDDGGIYLPRISRSSATPLCRSVSKINFNNGNESSSNNRRFYLVERIVNMFSNIRT